MERCSVDIPLLKAYSSGHMTACHLYEDGVPVAG